MKRTTTLGTLLALSLLTSTAAAQTYTEGFEGGSNDGDWEIWWANYNAIETTGGNPGSYLRFDNLSGSATCHWVEIFPNTWPAGFTGDWRAAQVDSIGLDVDVTIGPFTSTGEWSFIIGNDNGTPGDDTDDCTIEYNSPQMPPGAPGWTSFDFPIPTSSLTLPVGWAVNGTCGGGGDGTWNYVIQDVDYFRFRMDSDPSSFCNFWNWDMGVDNIRVEASAQFATYCFGDGSGTACPCGNNNNGAEGGCDWGDPAFPEGGILDATGGSSIGANDTYLVATGVSNDFGIFFGADNQVNGGNGNPLNDGLRCAGGGLVRLIPPTMASGNQATTPMPIQTLDTGAAAGQPRRYQYWFRTPGGPCGQTANLTNGFEIVWTP